MFWVMFMLSKTTLLYNWQVSAGQCRASLELHDLFVPAGNRSISVKRVNSQESKSAPAPCFNHSLKTSNSCYLSCLLCSISSKERGSFWSPEMEPALCCMDLRQAEKKSVSCEAAVGLECGKIEDHKAQQSTRASFQWTVKGSGRGAREREKHRVQQRRESDPTAGLIDLLCGRMLFSQLARSYLSRNTSHTHTWMLAPANTWTHANAKTNKQTDDFSDMHIEAYRIPQICKYTHNVQESLTLLCPLLTGLNERKVSVSILLLCNTLWSTNKRGKTGTEARRERKIRLDMDNTTF